MMEKPSIINPPAGANKRNSIFVGLAVLFVIVPFGLCVLHVAKKLEPVREEPRFLQQFHDNRDAFEQLLTMLLADAKVKNISNSETQPFYSSANEISATRLEEYKFLMRRAGVRSAFRDGDDLGFSVASWGGLDHGWSISVTWRQEPPTNTVASLDSPRKNPLDRAYRHIDGNWYLRLVRI